MGVAHELVTRPNQVARVVASVITVARQRAHARITETPYWASLLRSSSSLGTPTNSIRPLMAMAGVDITRYFTAISGCCVMSISLH